MFSFFQRKKNTSADNALAFIGVDVHNHILPGIDDGSPDLASSERLIEGLVNLGYKKMICTPHVLADVHPNNQTTIAAAANLLAPLISEKYTGFSMSYAAEYMVDYEFENLVSTNQMLSFGEDKQVLIEMSYLVESPNLRNMIFALLTSGYQPILAHPERYTYLHHRFSDYEIFRDAGCDLQVNLLSLSGYYGPPMRRAAEKLIDAGLVSWLGTDMHHERHLEALFHLTRDKKAMRYLDKITHLKNRSLLKD